RPLAPVDVVEQGARGVGGVGDVAGAGGHAADHIGVDSADDGVAGLHTAPGPLVVAAHPSELGAGEVGVQAQPGDLGDAALVPGVAQFTADAGGAPVLPDDGSARGASALAVPQHRGLALVG